MNFLKSAFAAFLLLASLSKTTAQSADPLNYIPKQAQNVYVLNLPALLPKMDLKALKEMDFFKEIVAKVNNQEATRYLNNPTESGINFLKPMAIVISPIEGSDYQAIATIMPLANAEKFKILMATSKGGIQEKEGLNLITGDTSILAWNAQMFVTMQLKKKKDPMKALAALGDSTVTPDVLPTLDPSVYFQNSEANGKADALRALMRTPHDVYIYQTTDGTGSSMKGMMASMMFGLKPEDLDGNITSGWADFENGRIIGETTQKVNEAMEKKFKSLGRSKPSVDWNNYINATNAQKTVMAFSFSFNPLGLKDMIADNPMLKMGVEAKAKDKFSMDKAFDVFGGDVFATMFMGDKGMDMLMGVSISDKKSVEKMLKDDLKAKKMGKNLYIMQPKKPVVTEDTPTDAPMPEPKVKSPTLILLKDNVALIGKESQILALNAMPRIAAAKAETEWQKSLKNKPFNLYFDVNALSASLGPLAAGKLDDIPVESLSMSLYNKVSTFELKMVDKDKNAISAFFTFVDKMMQKEKTKKAELEKLKKEGDDTEDAPKEKKGDGN